MIVYDYFTNVFSCFQECNQQLNDFSTTTSMKNAGWSLDLGAWQNNNNGRVAQKCRRGNNWFGWSGGAGVGTISIVLQAVFVQTCFRRLFRTH